MTLADWKEFFAAVVGASSALAGLVIVALSVNVKAIIAIPSMTSRVAATVAALVLVLLTSAAGLIPRQPLPALGAEVLVAGAVVLVVAIGSARHIVRSSGVSRGWALAKGLLVAAPTAAVVVGGALCLVTPAGLPVIAAGMLLLMAAAVTNTWVVLVEVLR